MIQTCVVRNGVQGGFGEGIWGRDELTQTSASSVISYPRRADMGYEFVEVGISSRGTSYKVKGKPGFLELDNLDEAMEMLKADPGLYEGVQSWWGKHIYLYKRGAECKPETKNPKKGVTWTCAKFDTGLGDGSNAFKDEYSEGILSTFQGTNITASLKRVGRGEGLYDVEGLKLFGDVDPMDVAQGGIGDCWFVSSMSAVAEFDNLIQQLFKEDDVNEEGKYTVNLFDLPSAKWKTYEIDDRLFTVGNRPRFSRASPDNEVMARA
jgi:hypothetical protein